MVRVASGRSNIYTAAARAKARKASLIDLLECYSSSLGPESIGAVFMS